MSHHAMRSRRVRQYRARKRIRGFREIVRKGGSVVCAPDVYAAIEKSSDLVGVFGGIALRSNPHVPPGHIYAIARNEFLPPNRYEISWTEFGERVDGGSE